MKSKFAAIRRIAPLALACAWLAAALPSCATEPEAIATTTGGAPLTSDPGALVGLTLQSQVGVVLDEVPASMRDRVAQATIARPAAFWLERAKAQLRLATYRLVFRQYFYGGKKMQLPLPPESTWQIALKGKPARSKVDGHDAVVVGYTFTGTLLTDAASPGVSEPKLAKIGGSWDEPFVFPVDPELLLQRTGYACMDEEDFPPGSVDSEEVDSFYDQDCTVEKSLSATACHQTVLPDKSCVQALVDHVGKVETTLRFTRLPWHAQTAAAVRVSPATTGQGADLRVVEEEFKVNRLIYRYIPPDSCALVEQCVGGSGWRRLLQFATSDENVGSRTLAIGAVDYYLSGVQTLNDLYHIFEYDACHRHYHFTHYGKFAFGDDVATTHKRGFCLQSTNRVANREDSPLHNPYGGCDFQGVEVGWVDQYKAGLPCQWIDVTTIDTSAGPVTKPLSFTSNPDGFLCEGEPVLDAQGNPTFEPTAFTTKTGETVYRPQCQFADDWFANNGHSYDVTLPPPGQGYVTAPCTRGQLGPLRNCGLQAGKAKLTCKPGQPATMHCTVQGKNAAAQVVRLCEHSFALGAGTACTFQDGVASQVVDGSATFSFTCPPARDGKEPGGAVSLYTGAVFPDDAAAGVSCTVL